jgi:hypothetical protein
VCHPEGPGLPDARTEAAVNQDAPPAGKDEEPAAASPATRQSDRSRTVRRTRKPPRPRTLKELAAAIRRDHPRRRNVHRFLDLIADNDEVSFEEIADKVHQANVEDDAIEKTIGKARKAIVGAILPVSLVVSDRRVSKRPIPRNVP